MATPCSESCMRNVVRSMPANRAARRRDVSFQTASPPSRGELHVQTPPESSEGHPAGSTDVRCVSNDTWRKGIRVWSCATLFVCRFFANIGSGGPLWSHSRGIACFSDTYELLNATLRTEIDIPEACAKGHPLTPENLHMDEREGRWRCRWCGRERAAAFRIRGKTAA
jgi:hypothetical protein